MLMNMLKPKVEYLWGGGSMGKNKKMKLKFIKKIKLN